LENATIGLHWVNAEGIIIWANRAELKMLGYRENEYIGHHISKFHKSQDCISDILSRLATGEVLQNHEAEMLCKDGSSKFVNINSSVLWEGDKFVHTRCFTIDISAEKIAAEAVQESEQRFKIMADLVPLVIWTSDENGMCTFLNGRWKELTGKEIGEGIGNQWLKAVHPEDQVNIWDSWNKSLAMRSVFEAKFRMINGKGGHTVCYFNAIPRFDSNAKFLGYTGTIQDFSMQEQITASLEKMVLERTNDVRLKNRELSKAQYALKIKNAELEKINNELSSFAHVASHDLQEPLRKIQTFTDRVLKTEADKFSEKSLGFMNKIANASARMRGLIQDILLYSKANNSETVKEQVDLNHLLQEVVLEFEVKIEEKNAIIDCSGGLPILHVTRYQFHQVFLNLLSNALKFSKPDIQPYVRISSSVVQADQVLGLDCADEYYDIRVADNGIGFEAEDSDRMFEMFNRLPSGNQYEGTGIGLAICKKMIERHGGKLVADGASGVGATFHIYLPVNSVN
jgi:PAS domain S-box-containing protein